MAYLRPRVHDIKVRSAEGQVKLAPRGATP
jgi:hypothetical protein